MLVLNNKNQLRLSTKPTPGITDLPSTYVNDNGDVGLAMMMLFNADVSDIVFDQNKYGVTLSVGSGRNVFSSNHTSGYAMRATYLYSCPTSLRIIPVIRLQYIRSVSIA